jgi:protein gp37
MEKSSIQWTDATINFWIGCQKVSAECKFCYMFRQEARYGRDGSVVRRTGKTTFNAALKWKEPKRIFTCSMSDFFIEEADDWRADAWDIIRRTPHHTWLILTKRPDRIQECLPDDWGPNGYPNVWLGTTIGVQSSFHRAEALSKIPAAVRFISAEPLLEPVDFLIEKDGERVIDAFHWVILGGESGNNTGKHRFRPSEIEWYEKAIFDLKTKTNVAVFMKQLGTHLSMELKFKKDRHGGEIENWPEHLRIREFPV